jgi:alpha-glucosidase
LAVLGCCAVSIASGAVRAQPPPAVTALPGPVPAALRQALRLSAFYQKYLDAQGLPVLSSDKVSDAALQEAAEIANAMLGMRDDIRRALIRNRLRIAVMAPTEVTTDIPEHSDLDHLWDRRARGLGATKLKPVSSGAEENLLISAATATHQSIIIHEFAHTIHRLGLNSIDPDFDLRLQDAYRHAMGSGLWAKTYSTASHGEYWADAVQAYFNAAAANDGLHNDIDTREKLAAYDPELFALIDQAFAKTPWRYLPYELRHRRSSGEDADRPGILLLVNSRNDASRAPHPRS